MRPSDLSHRCLLLFLFRRVKSSSWSNPPFFFFKSFFLVGPSVPPAVSYTRRGQALSVESDHREEWDGARRLELSTSKGDVPASPLGAQERKKTTSAVGVWTF